MASVWMLSRFYFDLFKSQQMGGGVHIACLTRVNYIGKLSTYSQYINFLNSSKAETQWLIY